MKRFCLLILVQLLYTGAIAQLKFLVEDFEGLQSGSLSGSGLYQYGNIEIEVDEKQAGKGTYSGKKCLRVSKNSKVKYGGFGKGITWFVDLDASTDKINFYVLAPGNLPHVDIRVEIQDDDNEDNVYNKDMDDAWTGTISTKEPGQWELVSLDLNTLKDESPGGDGKLNLSWQTGKLPGIMFTFPGSGSLPDGVLCYLDFISFSKGRLPLSGSIWQPAAAGAQDFCTLGAWSYGEGHLANFVDIAHTFEGTFGAAGKNKLGVVHFFQPFGKDDGSSTLYPSAERINRVIAAGYVPMITLENHFVAAGGGKKQPNLYSIVEGHFDSFFGYWCHLIKDVKGVVLLRILHEFNGDWYEWSTSRNDKNPELVARTFRYIHNIFKENNVTNVRFIWCPNSMSLPQEKWNYLMYAYPGDEYVDFVALDVYNGAGSNSKLWRSFRKEAIENYFVLTEKLPHKPLLICEAASRERGAGEGGQSKGEWIEETAISLKTDLSRIRLLAWFNQTDAFKVNSSPSSKAAFEKMFFNDPYFRAGSKDFLSLIR